MVPARHDRYGERAGTHLTRPGSATGCGYPSVRTYEHRPQMACRERGANMDIDFLRSVGGFIGVWAVLIAAVAVVILVIYRSRRS